jgi:hypothetical protein
VTKTVAAVLIFLAFFVGLVMQTPEQEAIKEQNVQVQR